MLLRLHRSRGSAHKPRLKPSHRRHFSRLLLFLLLSLPLLLLRHHLPLSLPRALRIHLGLDRIGRSHLGGSFGRVTTWPTLGCRSGNWATIPSPYSPGQFPFAVVRDAVVDRRTSAKVYLGQRDPPGARRVVLYVTTHLSARHTREGSIVTVGGGDVQGSVEYVAQADTEAINKVKGWYVRGMETKHKNEVSEWQIGLVLTPRGRSDIHAVDRALREDRALNVSLRVVRFFDNKGEGVPLQVNMRLGCIMGWETPGLEHREEVCGDGQLKGGSVVLLAKPLHGERKRDLRLVRQVADFAARALLGPLRFDAVVVPVVADVSVSEMDINCERGDVACREGLEEVNNGVLNRVADAVEEDLEDMGVPTWMFSRVMLVPTCRLGSHANGTEKEDPCRMSKAHGQYQTSFSSYSMIAPFFKWAASYDLDEFLSSAPIFGTVTPGPAESILDAADARNESELQGYLSFGSIEFHVESDVDSRTLTSNLLREQLPRLKNREDIGASGQCYKPIPNTGGKSAVRCDRGLGFTIHYPAVQEDWFGMQLRQGKHRDKQLRTWHARLGEALGKCEYDPPMAGGA